MRPLRISIADPVSLNNAYFTARNGKRVKTQEARAYSAAVELLTIAAAREQGFIAAPERLALTFLVSLPDNRRRDLDGLVKLAQDAICAALGVDDSRVHRLTVIRCANDPARGAYMEALVEEAEAVEDTAAELSA